jgi:BirA family biotin operon repressor/biotin-[acetyl-CoA-carboxylase] ligase
MNIQYQHFESLPSTSDYVKQNWQKLNAITVISTDLQTAGRGQGKDTWESTPGGMFASILMKEPQLRIPLKDITLKVADTIRLLAYQNFGIQLHIRYPNDLLYEGKKICGILTESSLQGGQINYLAIGIGFNFNQKVFSKELKDIAISLHQITNKIYDVSLYTKLIFEQIAKEISK